MCDRINSGILVVAGGFCISISLLLVSFIKTPFDLFLFFGVFTAISVSMCGWGPSLVQVQRSFKHNLGFAIGFVSSGIGVGMVIAVPLIQLCIDTFGWRNCFRILSVITFVVIIPIGLFLTKNFVAGLSSQSLDNKNPKTSSLNLSQAFKTGQFWLLVSLYFFGSMGAQTLHVHQVVYLVEKGISPIVGASVVSAGNLSHSREQRTHASGYPMNDYHFKIIDPETGKDQAEGIAGELLIKGYANMQEYWKKPEATAATIDANGWIHSGDMAMIRKDGMLVFMGRYKDMLKVGGENVSPAEIEVYLRKFTEIRDAAVVGYPDERMAEVPVAFIITEKDSSIDSEFIINAMTGKIASFKIPRHTIIVDEFPMTSSGKIRKVELRKDAIKILQNN